MATKSGVGDLKEADLKGIGPVDNNLTFKNTAGLGDRDSFSIVRDTIICQRRMPGYKTSGVYETDNGGMTTLHKVLTNCIVKEKEVKMVVVRGGHAVLAETVWFHKEDKKNDPEFAKKLASPSDRYALSVVRAAMGLKTSYVKSFMKEELVDYQKAKCKVVPLMLPYDSNIINRTCLEEPLVDKEEAWARQLKAEAGAVAPKVVNLIHAVVHQNKDTNVNVPVQMAPPLNRVFHIHNKRLRSEGSSQPPISFSDDDLEGLDLPHDDALVIALKVGDCLVDKILVDQGSACDVLYFHLFEKLGLKPEDLKETDTVLSGFDEQEVHPMGVVTLPILAGSLTVQTDFLVVNVSSAYNAIVGRPWLHKIKAIPSSYHQKLKFRTEEGIEEIRGDQNASKACGMIAVKPKIVPASGIANDGCNMGLDSGPMAMFDFDKFAEEINTQTDAKELEDLGGKGVTTTITGGGDSVAAVEKVGPLQLWRRLVSWRR